MLKRLLCAAVLLFTAFFVAGCTGEEITVSWTATELSHEHTRGSWAVTADTIDGYAYRDVTFGTGNLVSFYAESGNRRGRVTLTLAQDGVEKVLTLDREYAGRVDMDGFKPGRVHMRLDFENATDLALSLNW
jgi:hypothetical protein